MKKSYFGFLIVAGVLSVIDQYFKYYVRDNLYKQIVETDLVALGDFKINLYMVINKGVSFSLFSNNNQIPILVLMGVVVLILLLWLKFNDDIVLSAGITMIIGGAIGNAVDRINLGGVFDFISVLYGKYYFPTFNTADIFISIGVLLILSEDIFAKKYKKV